MIYVLRLLHIISGAFWYGSLLFMARFLAPSLRAAGPAGGAIMAQLNQRRTPMAMLGAGFVNVASGIWLILLTTGGKVGPWMHYGMGRTLAFGGAMAIIGLIVGVIVAPPAAKRLGEIGAAVAKRGGPPSPDEAAEIARLQGRIASSTAIGAVLLTLAVAAMAVARYVP